MKQEACAINEMLATGTSLYHKFYRQLPAQKKVKFLLLTPPKNQRQSPIFPPRSQLQVKSLTRLGLDRVQLPGKVDPMDLVYINGGSVQTDTGGNFDLIGGLSGSRRLRVTVRGPSVRERYYVIPVPEC